jgi:hypothetical protein
MAGPALGYLMVNLPKAIATILQTIITAATLGLQLKVVGTVAKIGNKATVEPPEN